MDVTRKKKFWVTLVVFSLMGQVAWVVENMYFNVFIYKMFHATAENISLMVSASAIAATLTTWLIGALSDRIGKRKLFICGGYILWGVSILSFAFIRMDVLTPIAGSSVAAASLGVTLVILMDCVMTFFGSSANDACFNAWLTDCGNTTNRGKIEGINSMMPLVAILVVFGGFMAFDLDSPRSWVVIYTIIGTAVILIGIFGFFVITDTVEKTSETSHYWQNVFYSFRPSVVGENKLLYTVVTAFAVFGISIQIFMPYLILYYEKTLGMENYVLIMAPAILFAAVITAFYGKLYDQMGFEKSVIPTVLFLMIGYTFLYLGTGTIPVFIGSLFMMTGYLTGMAIFGAMIRDHIPENKAGMFQGLRIFGQVFVPGIIGPAIGAAVLRNAQVITNSDGTTSFLPNRNIFLAAFLAAVGLLFVLNSIFLMIRFGHYDLESELEVQEKAGMFADKGTPWSQYPRPQFKRDSFYSLNGTWKLDHHKILVPFPPQSRLSGYKHPVVNYLFYKKEFELPENFQKQRLLLHFGAVDQVATVHLNGKRVGFHEGGYLPFTLDITEAYQKGTKNLLQVDVVDRLSARYPYGKQRKDRGGMWYTQVSGIWQSVWIESVDEVYIKNIRITPKDDVLHFEIDTNAKEYQIYLNPQPSCGEELTEFEEGENTILITGREPELEIDFSKLQAKDGSAVLPQYWTPEHPYLYQMKVVAENDSVETYFALRTVTIEEIKGQQRICLNHKPVFLHGVLDQGYFCEGIFLPAREEGFVSDIEKMKELGYNTLRKHIKIEPEAFYYACDVHGMLVMQDMVNSGQYRFIRDTVMPTIGSKKKKDKKLLGSRRRKEFFISHMKDTVTHLYNHPSIVGYTIFNEGWGQFDSDQMYERLKKLDDTRFIDSTSGWFIQTKSDVDSQHVYFKTIQLPKTKRPLLVSECGGYSFYEKSHIYSKYGNYGYGDCHSKEALTDEIVQMYEKMILPAIPQGCCGSIYTQLSDVEDETNGLYTYDRKLCKVDILRMQQISKQLLDDKML